MNPDAPKLKESVRQYWNKQSCGTDAASKEKFSSGYFHEIEEFRYRTEPEIFSFAQFTRFRDKKILEVGVGAGTDFLQWVRAGAIAHGVDLTKEAIDNTSKRLAEERLTAEYLDVADSETLPFADGSFDLVYSWGVIHHSPDTEKCLDEIVRVTRPGGTIKLMLYNRKSIPALYMYLSHALFRGKPFQSISKVLYNNQESLGTKAYTFKEVRKMAAERNLKIEQCDATVRERDFPHSKPVLRFFWYCLACLWGWGRAGWFMTIEMKKVL